MMKRPPSLIKWSGSKRSQAVYISKYFPMAKRYIEPFLGGGALLFYAADKYNNIIANDIYSPLVEFWNSVKKNPEDVIKQYKNDWENLQNDFPDYYYFIRNRFNSNHKYSDLVFLSRTCTNGIIRFNNKGEFNNSLHVTRRGMQPDKFKNIVYEWSERIQKVDFITSDYFELLNIIKQDDFIYMDPPYFNSKNRYISNLDYDKFLLFLSTLNERNVKWALSFDGHRGDEDYTIDMPKNLYKRKFLIENGHSSVMNVLSNEIHLVRESLILNF